MEIPLAIFYYIYAAAVLVFLIFTLFNIYHLMRFGYLTISNILIVIFYIFGSVAILAISWDYIGAINWHQSIQIISTLNAGYL